MSTRKFTITAACLWIASFIYFPVQIFVASAWSPAFDWRNNYTSNLGNTVCGQFEEQYVCSPRHDLMNATFTLLGFASTVGGVLFARVYREHRLALAGFSLLAIGGVGSMTVGLVPENIDLELHSLGALMPFLLGNIGVLLLGFSSFIRTRAMRAYTAVTGVIGVIAFFLFDAEQYLGLGVGGMERLTDYVQVLWLIVYGMYALGAKQLNKRTRDA